MVDKFPSDSDESQKKINQTIVLFHNNVNNKNSCIPSETTPFSSVWRGDSDAGTTGSSSESSESLDVSLSLLLLPSNFLSESAFETDSDVTC